MEELPKSHCYLTYDEVISRAQTIQPHFEADLSKFTLYDPWCTPAVNAQLLSGIASGQDDSSENSLNGDIMRLTNLLELKLAEARHCYEKLNYFVDRTFNDATISDETFGYAGFELARSSVKKMIPLLNQAHEAILHEGNEASLLAAFMPPNLPSELADIAAELAVLNGELKTIKKQHLIMTRERIELFNSLWDILTKLCDDAKIIFANVPARLAIYELYDIGDTERFEHLEHT